MWRHFGLPGRNAPCYKFDRGLGDGINGEFVLPIIQRSLALLLCGLFAATATADAVRAADVALRFPTTVTPQRGVDQRRLPVLLSDRDAQLYRQLFAAARQHDTATVDTLAGQLADRLLLGHVLAYRYTGGLAAADPEAAATWLESYGDLPQAGQIAAGLAADVGRGSPSATAAIEGSQLWAMYRAGQSPYPSSRANPESWQAGLSAWRSGDYPTAAGYFEEVAGRSEVSAWTRSAGAFWAARAHLFAGQPAQVAPLLQAAAAEKHTFYGLLARRILGQPIPYDWSLNDRDLAALRTLVDNAAGRRALALIEIEEYALAEHELAGLVVQGDVDAAHGAMLVAEAAGSAELCFKLQKMLRFYGIESPRASYPVPRWTPAGGFTTDRALVYALIRQESNFNPRAVSSAGARGVMQLMPATARYVVRRTGMGDSSLQELYEPEANIALGQQYLDMLLNDGTVGPDLFRLTAAWNGGPGNLGRWMRDPVASEDALLFIESIPLSETRDFVERILANLWIYRHRLGEPTPSLDALAAGQWPGWDGGAASPVEVAEQGRE